MTPLQSSISVSVVNLSPHLQQELTSTSASALTSTAHLQQSTLIPLFFEMIPSYSITSVSVFVSVFVVIFMRGVPCLIDGNRYIYINDYYILRILQEIFDQHGYITSELKIIILTRNILCQCKVCAHKNKDSYSINYPSFSFKHCLHSTP